ncbi:hypothetical protein [Sulfurisphaera ohwakuensis]|uniref:Uncharacterized protein n=1 Tax=Sulfurisphaera ohwakuensis TaxID=69656 RepID=A0A650CJA6_SULOH|nr:hypothetical protein [Sulfurisphaera ohwakuensis]MBB5254030.1 hypothetical protein [Sulfurisphaera ohwakuensis]QGR17910.1 hypothetical protein D1869_12530 [Sulfurisphaera ohwakuensis]
MSINEERLLNKIDYRIIEIKNISPSAEVRAIVITNKQPSTEIVNDISTIAKVELIMPFLSTVKVKAKAKDLLTLAEKDYVKFIMLEEVLAKLEEF